METQPYQAVQASAEATQPIVPSLENEQGFLSRIGETVMGIVQNTRNTLSNTVEHARDNLSRAAALGGIAVAGIGFAGAAELGYQPSEADASASATPTVERALSFNECANIATHPNRNQIKSEFGATGSLPYKKVEVKGEARDITGCDGRYNWKVQIFKENKSGYHKSSGKVSVARGIQAKSFDKIFNTKGGFMNCDGSYHANDGTFDAIQKNYLTYRDLTGQTKTCKFTTPVKASTRYC